MSWLLSILVSSVMIIVNISFECHGLVICVMLWWVRKRILPSIFNLFAFSEPHSYSTLLVVFTTCTSHSCGIYLNTFTARLNYLSILIDFVHNNKFYLRGSDVVVVVVVGVVGTAGVFVAMLIWMEKREICIKIWIKHIVIHTRTS